MKIKDNQRRLAICWRHRRREAAPMGEKAVGNVYGEIYAHHPVYNRVALSPASIAEESARR